MKTKKVEKIEAAINIHDAVKEAKKEKKRLVISGRQAQFIQLQNQYREQLLNLCYMKEELEQIGSQILLENHKKVLWMGMPFPDRLLKVYHDKKLFIYSQVLSNFKQLEMQLKNFGMTKTQLDELASKGKILKNPPKKVKVE